MTEWRRECYCCGRKLKMSDCCTYCVKGRCIVSVAKVDGRLKTEHEEGHGEKRRG